MTKFLKQKAEFSKAVPDTLDLYGNPVYEDPVEVRCRRERVSRESSTATGTLVTYATAYYVDSTVQVAIGDMFDGKLVVDFSDYVNSNGEVEGYEAVVG